MRTTAMHRSSWPTSLGRTAAAVLALGALVAWALGPSAAGAATGPRSARVVSTVQNAELGTILVVGTSPVYTVKPGKAACTAACVKAWPPVLLPHGVTTPTAGMGVEQSKLGTAKAAHGARQITYSGKRLYLSAKDTTRGRVHGSTKTKWGTWSAVTAAALAAPTTAAPATEAPSTEPPTTEVPATDPPVTEAPATEAPATQPTEPPTTKPAPPTSPGTGGVAF